MANWKKPRDDSHSLHIQPQCNTFSEASIFSPKQGGYLRDMPSVLDPPDLDLWRERLFNVDETIVLSEEQYVLVPTLAFSRARAERNGERSYRIMRRTMI